MLEYFYIYCIISISFGISFVIRVFPELTREIKGELGRFSIGLKITHYFIGLPIILVTATVGMPLLVRVYLSKDNIEEYIRKAADTIVATEKEISGED